MFKVGSDWDGWGVQVSYIILYELLLWYLLFSYAYDDDIVSIVCECEWNGLLFYIIDMCVCIYCMAFGAGGN